MLINHQSLRLDAATLRTSTIRKDLLRRKSSRLHPISCSSTFITQNNRMRQSKLNQIHREDMTAGMLGDLNYFISPTSHLYDNFLNFTTAEHQSKALHEEYRTFKRSGFNIQMTLFVAFLNAGYFASRGSIQHLWNLRRLHPLFLIGFTCGISAIMFIGIALFNRLAILSDAYGIKCLQPYKTGAVQRMKTQRSQLIEDIIVVLVAFSQSLYLLGRTLEGECPDNSTLFDSQECNPQATSHALPQDQLVYLFVGVLFIQVFLKGASKYAILLSWMINILFVNVSLWIVGSDQYVWLNVSLLLCLSLSYEVERSTLCMFLERKICIKTMINNAATEKVAEKMADQRDSVNRVNIELQGTIINSAHDMKSPCTGIENSFYFTTIWLFHSSLKVFYFTLLYDTTLLHDLVACLMTRLD